MRLDAHVPFAAMQPPSHPAGTLGEPGSARRSGNMHTGTALDQRRPLIAASATAGDRHLRRLRAGLVGIWMSTMPSRTRGTRNRKHIDEVNMLNDNAALATLPVKNID